MSVWFLIPSARPPEEAEKVLKLWRQQGYKVALLRDAGEGIACDYLHSCLIYRGYAQAVNSLVKDVIELDPAAEWFVTGGDDTEPDLNYTAEEIAEQCSRHFGLEQMRIGKTSAPDAVPTRIGPYSTFGVMQPTGDRYAGGCIDRIAGSPWMGRDFCQRIYGGKGPLWPEFTHMFVDEHLKCVAEKLGIFWQRPDLIHLHRHFMRVNDSIDSPAVLRDPPAHLVTANSQEHWNSSQRTFERLRDGGFKEANNLLPVGELAAR